MAEVAAARARTEAAAQGTQRPLPKLVIFPRLTRRIFSPLPAAAARRAAGADARLSGAAAFAALYAERLGLRLGAGAAPGEWAVTFTNVDPAEPTREFRFALRVGEAAYALAACEPPLATAPALLAALNAAPRAGLPRFVAGMRAAFAQLARTGSDTAALMGA